MRNTYIATLTLAIIYAAAGIATTPAADDGAMRSMPGPDAVVKMLSDKLALTPAQVESITPIITERQQQIRALMDNSDGSGVARRREMRRIFVASDTKINALLTQPQRENYAAVEKQMREQMRERRQQ
jgi:periplasmic protein CpxP/Spy